MLPQRCISLANLYARYYSLVLVVMVHPQKRIDKRREETKKNTTLRTLSYDASLKYRIAAQVARGTILVYFNAAYKEEDRLALLIILYCP